ncbi:MAG: hypothetical protein GY906_39295 [bacterium]|nr:hypothetical protein [bacterium]
MPIDLVPAVDSAGLPGPAWLFHLLLVFTFFLHLLFLNLALGGTLLAAVAHTKSGGRKDHPCGALARRLVTMNSFGISLAITTGVAPLLFIQVLYHQYFYTGTILIGGAWFGLVGLLIAAYYAAYLYKLKGAPTTGTGGGGWIWSAAIAFLLIAAIHVSVHLVHVQPAKWADFAESGWRVLLDPTFAPRLLHFVFAGVGFSALISAWWAVRQASRGIAVELNSSIAAIAWKWALWSTVAVVVDGVLLLMLLPREVLLGLMQGGAAVHIPLTLGILGAIGLLVMMARVHDPVKAASTVGGTLHGMILVVAIMALTRHEIRLVYLQPTKHLQSFTVASQWFNFGLFVVVLLACLGVVAFMVRRVLTSPAEGSDAA